MYVVKKDNGTNGEIVAFASRKEDAEAMVNSKLDKGKYTCSQMNSYPTAQ